jgi:phage tail sheath protein FI
MYLRTDASRGVFKAPAGFGARLALAVATQSSLSNSDLDTLNTGTEPINAIRQIPGSGIVAMGARTMNNTPANRYINVRRSMMFLKTEIRARSNFAVFENNDSILWGRLNTSLSTFLRSYWQQGGLRGTSPTDAFYVICDASNNSAADIQNGIVNIEVGVALEYPAEFIVIKLGQLTGNATA